LLSQIRIDPGQARDSYLTTTQANVPVPGCPGSIGPKIFFLFFLYNFFSPISSGTAGQHKIKVKQAKISVPDAFQIKSDPGQLPFKDFELCNK
jgi:hypothetical protein